MEEGRHHKSAQCVRTSRNYVERLPEKDWYATAEFSWREMISFQFLFLVCSPAERPVRGYAGVLFNGARPKIFRCFMQAINSKKSIVCDLCPRPLSFPSLAPSFE